MEKGRTEQPITINEPYTLPEMGEIWTDDDKFQT
ncbi:hypothetical protein Cha6605_3068 [Chamaesiphon minutus PCC 6605]|uniref:Uncharacterized protein n=1 Tax=Chamaesiphon minutus (strain ATCC 27169 / PCC 6605) TaxID=1173020 RepID=K9UI03_CHAP6|nr:hypothetical protein Cha6605_3068 [Chamaesiphon minutus PCC 6605]